MHGLEHDVAAPPPHARAAADGARIRAFALALGVPLAVTLLGLLPFALLPRLDGADRAFVWIAADDITLASVARRVEDDGAFTGGATRIAIDVPDGCPSGALRLHFDVTRIDEAQSARIALERLAKGEGAVVCASDRYEIGRPGDAMAWAPVATSLLLPLGLLFALRLAGDLRLPWPPPRSALAALAVAAVGLALAPATAVVAPWPATVVFALAAATVHEVAFRGWLMTRLLPSCGAGATVAASVGASTVAAAATGGLQSVPAAAAIALLCAALYLRSRSVALCIATHALAAAAIRVFAG